MSKSLPTPSQAKFRPFEFGVKRAKLHQTEGASYLDAEIPLEPYSHRMTDRLVHWAHATPDRTLFARRDPALSGEWRHLTFAQAWAAAQSIGQALLDRNLSAERPLLILSENSLEHALLALGAMVVGIPYCAASPAYSLVSQDFDKLRHVVGTLTPGLVYATDWTRYGRAIEAVVPLETEIAIDFAADYTGGERAISTFDAFLGTSVSPRVQAAMEATGPDTIVKFLFTSGSTKLPKAVINTQRMICANQQQMRQSMPALQEEPLILVDWMPWNHTAGGNHNFFMVVYNGGTLYIDDGKPTPALQDQTLRNLREVAPTWYFNVPVGFEAIANAMTTDAELRRNFLSRVRQFLYAGAVLAQPVWESLYASAEREYGERIVMTSSLGMTESGPFGLFVTSPHTRAGDIGLPCPGMQVKLVPMGDKVEVRYRGPNITPGYWRSPEATSEAFDDEGFFCSGDAVTWIDSSDIHQGLKFDGRIAEDFKLSTGTFVSVGPMRAKIAAAGAPYIQDVVMTGLNLKDVGAMIFPTPALRTLAGLPKTASMSEVAATPSVQAWLQELVDTLAQSATGSATRVNRAVILTEPPQIDRGEVTDKGSINQRAVLKVREALVMALHENRAEHMVQPRGT